MIRHRSSWLLFTVLVGMLLLQTSCRPSPPAPQPVPTSQGGSGQSATSTNLGTSPTRQPSPTQNVQSSSSRDRILRGAQVSFENECTKWYNEDVYDYRVLNIGEGNVTAKMKSNEGVQEIWCISVTGRCGNLERTFNYLYAKIDGKWSGAAHDADFPSGWDAAGCPFRMSR